MFKDMSGHIWSKFSQTDTVRFKKKKKRSQLAGLKYMHKQVVSGTWCNSDAEERKKENC